MKKLLLVLLLHFGCIAVYAQRGNPYPVDPSLSPNGFLDIVFDQLGNQYKLSDIKIDPTKTTKSGMVLTTSAPVAVGYFNLFFETNSGMEDLSNSTQAARRNVLIQVFQDISTFINSPLSTNGLNNKVNIWVRDISQINGVPSNALGLATAFYNMPNNSTAGFGGIADNEIWKTIHAGVNSYTNVVSPLISSGINSGTSGIFYHGMMAFNFNYSWNTNRGALANSTEYDLYTTVLHEVTHALGFGSLIGTTGSSQFGTGFNYYTRYDRFLKTSSNQDLLVSGSACSTMYNYTFNASLVSTLHPSSDCSMPNNTTCSSAIKFFGTPNTLAPVPVFNPNCWTPGSSLSHFEDGCFTSPPGFPSGNDLYFTMSNANNPGTNKRYLKREERLALVDLGYTIQPTYGVSSTLQGIPPANYYGTSITNGINVVGINDGITTTGTYKYSGTATSGNPIIINSAINGLIKILVNDLNATAFECLQDVYDATATLNGLATLNGTASTNVSFISSVPGVHLLRYVPVNASGQKGNITYIYVYVIDTTNCAVPSTCNLVSNGNFEQKSANPSGLGSQNTPYLACGWYSASPNASPDYFHVNSTSTQSDVPTNTFGCQSDNLGLNAYAGMYIVNNWIGLNTPFFETIRTRTTMPLQSNANYQISFDISLAEGLSTNAIKFQAYLSPDILIPPAIPGGIGINSNGLLLTSTTFATISNGWQKVTINFNTGALAGLQYLYLGGLNAVQFQQIAPVATGGNGCAFGSDLNGPANSVNGYSYYYLDNVSLNTLDGGLVNLPNSICLGENFVDLGIYLSGIPPNGSFTGTGVSTTAGVATFNSTIAGLGTHMITYSYTNSSGCPIVLYHNFVVSACSSTSCPGNLIFNTTEPAASATYQAANTITTSINYLVNQGSTITLKAGNSITFSPSSEVKASSTSNFTAQIGDCTQTSNRMMDEENPITKASTFIISPNPTNGFTTILMNDAVFNKVVISTIDGRIVWNEAIKDTSEYEYDTSNLTKGIYIISIETSKGELISKKLVKQ